MGVAPPLVVVGAGLAGLCTALACTPRPVLLLSASVDDEGTASELAQGGIAAALGVGDSVDAHARDTLAAGAGMNEPACVSQLAAAAPWAVRWLAAKGVAFDRDGDAYALACEGGHRFARILHAGGDATGARIMAALRECVRAEARIDWREGLRVDALLLRGGAIAGLRCVDGSGRAEIVETGAVVLATGGLGGLYAQSTNPETHCGAGLALAIAAGARLRDMEYVQFHPTALAVGAGRLPLITEALRGAGAVLRDARGRPAMSGIHPQGDLAPRDVVARRLWSLRGEGGAWLDATALPDGWAARFPTVDAICRRHGIDPASAPIPVTPAAHFHMGGIAVDSFGVSSLPRLYAVGEVACSGVHGANRLASNSLLECVVMGRRLGTRLNHAEALPGHRAAATRLCEAGPTLPPPRRPRLCRLMWEAAGPERSASAVATAIDAVTTTHADSMEERVAAKLLGSALANPRSNGAHWLQRAHAGVPAGPGT